MTDVLILKKFPGAKPGQILPLDARLQRHVETGNAKIIPNEHESWGESDHAPEAPPAVHVGSSSSAPLPALELVVNDDDDEATDDAEDD